MPKPSPPLSNTSQMGSSMSGGAGYQSGTHQGQFDHGSGSLSPSKKSPVGKSPPATGSAYGSSQKDESAASGGAVYTKRQVSHFSHPQVAIPSQQLSCNNTRVRPLNNGSMAVPVF